jgi:hypothetical protein
MLDVLDSMTSPDALSCGFRGLGVSFKAVQKDLANFLLRPWSWRAVVGAFVAMRSVSGEVTLCICRLADAGSFLGEQPLHFVSEDAVDGLNLQAVQTIAWLRCYDGVEDVGESPLVRRAGLKVESVLNVCQRRAARSV